MTDGSAPAAPAFAPSELVLLFGDRFAPEAGMLGSKEPVLTSGIKVSAQKLMDAAVQAAAWAVHRSGSATLEIRQGKALFGLMKTEKLHVVRGAAPAPFPAGSLEAVIAERSADAPELRKVLEDYIGAEVMDPSSRLLGLMKGALAGRGLLREEEKKTMMVFTSTTFALPEAARAAAAAQPLEPVRDGLRQAEQGEPALFRAVQKAIDGARMAMTESSD